MVPQIFQVKIESDTSVVVMLLKKLHTTATIYDKEKKASPDDSLERRK